MNRLTLTFDENLRSDRTQIQNIFQYSNTELVVLLSVVPTQSPTFNWITPGGVKLEERGLTRTPTLDNETHFAYKGTIYPGMTEGISTNSDSGIVKMSLLADGVLSPLIRIPVDRTILPIQTELIPTNFNELDTRTSTLEQNAMMKHISQTVSGEYIHFDGSGFVNFTNEMLINGGLKLGSTFNGQMNVLSNIGNPIEETDVVNLRTMDAALANSGDWNTAYAWGDHSLEGYLTSFTETDPVFNASPAAGITSLKVTNWDTAFNWGDHAEEGYLTNETVTSLSVDGNILKYVDENGTTQNIDLSLYIDDTNLARIISGTYDDGTQELVFTRDDASEFRIDASMFFDDTNLVTSVNGNTGAVSIDNVPTTTTVPTADYAGPGHKIAILTSEPATKYNGWIYFITA